MQKKLLRNFNGLSEFVSETRDDIKTEIYCLNTIHEIPDRIIKDSSVDLVVTSPPYGDSRNTVAYRQFSRLSSQCLQLDSANDIDKLSVGGDKEKEH